jgi:hypothetical protein
VVAHDPATAAIQTQRRSDRIDALIAQGEQWAGKLVEQDDGVKRRGRKLSDSGAKARFFHAVSEAHLSKIIKVDLAAQLFSYDIDDEARTLAEMMDCPAALTGEPKPAKACYLLYSRSTLHTRSLNAAY